MKLTYGTRWFFSCVSCVLVGVAGLMSAACQTLSTERQFKESLARAHDVSLKNSLTPTDDWVRPVSAMRHAGSVTDPMNLCTADQRCVQLSYQAGEEKPVVVVDLGKASAGGYAVFDVARVQGTPTLRVSYSCHPDGLSETGCFSRETRARYLGETVDLPVLPANVNRHELYTICRTGRYIAPLIQGQARYVRIQLDTPGTVQLDAFALVNAEVYDRSPMTGFFQCSDERINQLWSISTWTTQLASFPNHDSWKVVDGWLLPRKLEQGNDVGLTRCGADWCDVSVSTQFELRRNPHFVSSAGIVVRARDAANGYFFELDLDGRYRFCSRTLGRDQLLKQGKLAHPLIDGQRYALTVSAHGTRMEAILDGQRLDVVDAVAHVPGRIGFYHPKEKWALYDSVRVVDCKTKAELFSDAFDHGLDQWDFSRTRAFLADGAKRDRLVWSGDLYFAQRNSYYAHVQQRYLSDSLRMLAFNQTPDGYVHASPYPERCEPPANGDYGPFPSDEFAAWLIPVAWDHYLYTRDDAVLRDIWPAVQKLMAYLSRNSDREGLFVQRVETSKHAGNLNCGDVRVRSYMHILLWAAFRDGARLAGVLGLEHEQQRAKQQADHLKQTINQTFWNDAQGYFNEAKGATVFGAEANALALALHFATPQQAQRIAPQFKRISHGKFQSLASRGLFEYGYSDAAMNMIFTHNWLRLLEPSWTGAWTTTECMGLITKGWGDESHPDTAIAGHFSGYLLGVRPLDPGYTTCVFQPQATKTVTWAKGAVPTPQGNIFASWRRDAAGLEGELALPEGTSCSIQIAHSTTIMVNGTPYSGNLLHAGYYRVCATLLPSTNDHVQIQANAVAQLIPYTVRAAHSHEMDGWSTNYLCAALDEAHKKGFSSTGHASDQATEWIELDLGQEMQVSKLILYPRQGKVGFPRTFTVQFGRSRETLSGLATYTDVQPSETKGQTLDLYSVIGYPTLRYVRITAHTLGKPADDEDAVYRLQFRRIQVVPPIFEHAK